MSFQKTLNRNLPVGIEGTFASTNPYHALLSADEAQYKAVATTGVKAGLWAWVDPVAGTATNVKGSLTLGGVVLRENTATVLSPTESYSMTIRPGFEVNLYDGGDFWVRFPAGATIGQNVFAADATGIFASASATTLANHTLTPFKVASTAGNGELAKITSAK
jgi:hypothetical protein